MCVTLVCLFLTVTGLIVLDRYTREHAESSKPGYSVQHGQDWLALNDPIDGMVSDDSGWATAVSATSRTLVFPIFTTTVLIIDKEGTTVSESNICAEGRILIIGKQGVWHCLAAWTPVTGKPPRSPVLQGGVTDPSADLAESVRRFLA
jgi:hypothetical protein